MDEEERFKEGGNLVLATAELWNASFRRSRWCMTLYLFLNRAVLCEAGGMMDGFEESLYLLLVFLLPFRIEG